MDIRSAFVESNGKRAEGIPFFDGSFTDAHGVTGRLNAEIALATIDSPGISSEGQSLASLRRSSSRRAIVAVTSGGHPGLSLSNAASFSSPYGVPVLQVSSTDGAWLNELAGNAGEIRVVRNDAVTIDSTASDVVLLGGEISVDGGAGSNTLTLLGTKSAWNITARNALATRMASAVS